MEFDFKLEGFDEIMKKLDKLPAKVERNTVRRAIRAGGRVLVKETRSRVPQKTGNLKKSIGVKMHRIRNGVATLDVGPISGKSKKYDGWYGKFIELGTSRMPARPYLRPAFDASEADIIRAIAAKLREGIEREAGR